MTMLGMATRIFFSGSAASTVVSNGKKKRKYCITSEKGKMMIFPARRLVIMPTSFAHRSLDGAFRYNLQTVALIIATFESWREELRD
jgi:hypothetical protein